MLDCYIHTCRAVKCRARPSKNKFHWKKWCCNNCYNQRTSDCKWWFFVLCNVQLNTMSQVWRAYDSFIILTKWCKRNSGWQCTICRAVRKSRIHDRRDYRDFRLLPWFLAIAVISCHGREYWRIICNFSTRQSVLHSGRASVTRTWLCK